MRARLWQGIILGAAALMAAGAPVRADAPAVPAEADALMWCSVFYLNWSRGVHHQHRPALENELRTTSEALKRRAVAALPPDMDEGAVKAMEMRYRRAYQRTLRSSTPPRIAPETCEALAKAE